MYEQVGPAELLIRVVNFPDAEHEALLDLGAQAPSDYAAVVLNSFKPFKDPSYTVYRILFCTVFTLLYSRVNVQYSIIKYAAPNPNQFLGGRVC